MTKLLLDFPWPIDSVLLHYSEANAVLHDFERLCEQERLQRVPFVSNEEFCELVERPHRRAGLNTLRPVLQVLPHYLRDSFGTVRAMPVAGPNDLSDNWKFTLRQEMLDLDDWRTPQIIVCETRRNDWQPSIRGSIDRTEVEILCEELNESFNRVIAFLGSYQTHQYARSDGDPWDIRRTKTHDELRPCLLPKPPRLRVVSFSNLTSELENARSDGWHLGGMYYFIPPDDWSPEHWKSECTKRSWRDNGCFRHATAQDHVHRGSVDFEGRVWSWDPEERHWDVQIIDNGYWSISHTGRLLKRNE